MTSPPHGPEQRSAFSRRAFLKGASLAAVGGTVGNELVAGVDTERRIRTIGQGLHELTLNVNGRERKLQVEARTTLLDALRDELDLTGSKKICDRGACGGCTVHLDGKPVNSCLTLAWDAELARVTTIEGLQNGEELHPVQQSFIETDALQCGFCTPGMVMASVACLDRHAQPTLDQIRHELSGNICRCGTYTRVFEAVQKAAPKVRGRGRNGR